MPLSPTAHACPGLVATDHSDRFAPSDVTSCSAHAVPFQWPIFAPPAPHTSLVDSADMPLKIAPALTAVNRVPFQCAVSLPGMKSLIQVSPFATPSTDMSEMVPTFALIVVHVLPFQ